MENPKNNLATEIIAEDGVLLGKYFFENRSAATYYELPTNLINALISTEELEDLNQIMIKQLKNRYNDPTMNKRFIIGIDRAKMKLYDVEQTAQGDIVDSGQDEPVFDKSKFGTNMEKKNYDKFSDLKI